MKFYNTIAQFIITWGVDYDTVIECVPPILNVMEVLAKYLNGVFNKKKLREACNTIKNNCERLMGFPEYEVLHMHVLEGRKFALIFALTYAVLLTIYLVLPTVLIVNDIMTKNESEEKYLMYQLNYVFVDVQDHYYFATTQCYLASIGFIAFLCSVDVMYVTLIQHACTLFAVVGYRLKTIHVLNTAALKKEFGQRKYEKLLIDEQERMYEKLILCIKEHRKALEFSQDIQSAFSVTLIVQIVINIVCLSVTGVQALFKLFEGNIIDVIRFATWVLGQLFHLFFLYIHGQRLLDFSTQMYYDALESMWYKCFKKSQVLYQILLMNAMVPVRLMALKITVLNKETFLAVTQTAMSYFTVLSSTL